MHCDFSAQVNHIMLFNCSSESSVRRESKVSRGMTDLNIIIFQPHQSGALLLVAPLFPPYEPP